MNEFGDLLQEIVNMEYDELLVMAKTSLENLMPTFKLLDKENNGVFMVVAVVLAAVGSDGKLTPTEKSFVCDLLNLEPDTVSSMIKMYDGRELEMADTIADSLNSDLKASMISFVAAIAASDESIKPEEVKFLTKLLA